jgi:hypothetical protein
VPIPNGGRSALLDHPRLIGQLCHLERNVTRTGREQINPPPGAMDDLANAVAGALVLALVAVPSLWAADAFLVGDAPAALPRECMLLFAVIVADKHGRCGIAYFLPQLGRSLLVLDWGQAEYLTPAVLTKIPERLSKFSAAVHVHAWFIYTTKALEQEFRSLGIGNVEAADAVISEDDGLLRLAVAKHVIANKVKVVRRVNSQLTSLLEMREENPLTTSLMVGIVLALDPGRTLTESRAA